MAFALSALLRRTGIDRPGLPLLIEAAVAEFTLKSARRMDVIKELVRPILNRVRRRRLSAANSGARKALNWVTCSAQSDNLLNACDWQ